MNSRGQSARAIGIDASNHFDRPATGVAVYAKCLANQLAESHPEQRFIWHLRSNRYFRSLRQALPRNVERRLAEEFPCHPAVGKVALFHGLNQRLPIGPRVSVATFHDLFAMTGEYSTRSFRDRFSRLAVETARRADHIIAISKHTANLVEQRLGYPRSNITVIHHGINALEAPRSAKRMEVLANFDILKPFVLSVGTLQARKNVESLVAAFEAAGAGRRLVLAGGVGYGGAQILQRIRDSPARSRICLLGHVSTLVLASLYREAEVLLFPSLDEGFGLPVVEAMANGLPVITSTTTAMPEVAGSAAVLVEPTRVDAISDGLARVLASQRLQADLRAKGLERAKQFNWRRCAEETWRVYERLLSA